MTEADNTCKYTCGGIVNQVVFSVTKFYRLNLHRFEASRQCNFGLNFDEELCFISGKVKLLKQFSQLST